MFLDLAATEEDHQQASQSSMIDVHGGFADNGRNTDG